MYYIQKDIDIKAVKSKILYLLLALLAALVALTAGNTVGNVGKVFAATTEYSNVLDDLTKDESFNYNEYPENSDDYSLTLFQIAESNGGELFIYVYQPAEGNRGSIATSINISLTEEEPKFINYKLQFLNYEGTLFKYKVKDLACDPSAELRLYNISAIYRKYIDGVDEDTGNDNEITEVAFSVGKLFQARTNEDGEIKYECSSTEVIEIKNPYVDFLSYYNGLTWEGIFTGQTTNTDIHYIAFSPNRKIDDLEEADITYTTQMYSQIAFEGTHYGEKSDPKYITITKDMEFEQQINYFDPETYTWKCIQRSEDFIKSTQLNGQAIEMVQKTEFVLIFLTTQYRQEEHYSFMQGHGYDKYGTKVSDVAILRLKFSTEEKTYNLGVVMNKQEGDEIPGNQQKAKGFWEWLADLLGLPVWAVKLIVFGTLALIILGILSPILPYIIKPIWAVVKVIFKGILVVVSLPVKGIKKLAELHRKRKEEKQRESAQSNQADDRPPARKKSKAKSNKKRGKKK